MVWWESWVRLRCLGRERSIRFSHKYVYNDNVRCARDLVYGDRVAHMPLTSTRSRGHDKIDSTTNYFGIHNKAGGQMHTVENFGRIYTCVWMCHMRYFLCLLSFRLIFSHSSMCISCSLFLAHALARQRICHGALALAIACALVASAHGLGRFKTCVCERVSERASVRACKCSCVCSCVRACVCVGVRAIERACMCAWSWKNFILQTLVIEEIAVAHVFRKYERFMWRNHVTNSTCHVTHVNKSSLDICTRHATHINESCHTCGRVISNIYSVMSHIHVSSRKCRGTTTAQHRAERFHVSLICDVTHPHVTWLIHMWQDSFIHCWTIHALMSHMRTGTGWRRPIGCLIVPYLYRSFSAKEPYN